MRPLTILLFASFYVTAEPSAISKSPVDPPERYHLSQRQDSGFPLHQPVNSEGNNQSLQKDQGSKQNIIDTDRISLLLRWTCEINRQLEQNRYMTSPTDSLYDQDIREPEHITSRDCLRGGQTALYRLPATLSFDSLNETGAKKKRRDVNNFDELTIFHAKTPRPGRRGVGRWGPDLATYLPGIASILGISTDKEWLLTLLYLDRASSVETPRSRATVACPFCKPRTVHRLLLAAMLLAARATQENGAAKMNQWYAKLSCTLGVPVPQLCEMVTAMESSLGDLGSFVPPYRLHELVRNWNMRFRTFEEARGNEIDYVDSGS